MTADFHADLLRQRPAEMAVAKHLGGTLTTGNCPYDIVLPDSRRVEVKTEVSYYIQNLKNFYFEVCDIPDGVVLPKKPVDALGTEYETGIFRARKHDVELWVHGFRVSDTKFHYFMFDLTSLEERVREHIYASRHFTGKPIRNKRWNTLGCAVPLERIAPLISGMFMVEACVQ